MSNIIYITNQAFRYPRRALRGGYHNLVPHHFLYRIAVYFRVDGAPEITVLQLAKFKAEATELIGSEGIEALAFYLIDHPDAGDVIPGSGGVRKLRWAAKGKGKRGGARIIYLYVMMAARIYLVRCYAKNVKTDLTADEKKQLRQIAARLKGAH